MRTKNRYDGSLDEYAANLIRRKARQLVGRRGLVDEDRNDLEQEFATQLWSSQQKYDSSKSSPRTFATRVVNNKAANILAERKAAKRDAGRAPRRTGEEKDLEDETSEVIDVSDLREAERCREGEEALRFDLARAIAQLPEKHRDLCQRLMAGTVKDAAKDTNIPRSTLYGGMAEIRRHFERVGLRAHLGADVFPPSPVGTQRAGRSRRRR